MYLTDRSTPPRADTEPDTEAGAEQRRRRGLGSRAAPVVFVLGTVSLITDISSEMVTAVLPLYLVTTLGFSPLGFGTLDGVYNGVSALVQLTGGHLADRVRNHKLIAGLGYGLSALCKPLLLLASSIGTLGAVLALERTGKGLRTAPRDAMISLSTPPEHQGRAFGVHRAMDTTGAMLGPLAAFFILRAATDGYDAVFGVSACVAALGVLVLVLFVPGRQQTARPAGHGENTGRQGSRAEPGSEDVPPATLTTTADGGRPVDASETLPPHGERRGAQPAEADTAHGGRQALPPHDGQQAAQPAETDAAHDGRPVDASETLPPHGERRGAQPAEADTAHSGRQALPPHDGQQAPQPADADAAHDRRPVDASETLPPDGERQGAQPTEADPANDRRLLDLSEASPPHGRPQATQPAEAGAADGRQPVRLREALALLRLPRLRALAGCAALLGLTTVSDAFVYLLLQRRAGIGEQWFTLLPLGTAVVFLLLAMPVGALADRIGRRTVFLAGHAVLLTGYALLLWAPATPVLPPLVLALHGTFYAATDGVLPAALADIVPDHLRASGLAIVGTSQALARFCCSLAFGAAWTVWGDGPALAGAAVGLLGCAAVAGMVLRPTVTTRS